MLLATSINGIVFSLFSGQPLMIFGATGPFLVLEEMLYYVNTYITGTNSLQVETFIYFSFVWNYV